MNNFVNFLMATCSMSIFILVIYNFFKKELKEEDDKN
jgi:hypothetical protein